MAGRVILGLIFILAGTLHFIIPDAYLRIMPPTLPAHLLLIDISGAAEILGGIGLLVPFTRHLAAWGLVALLMLSGLRTSTPPSPICRYPSWRARVGCSG